MYENNKTGETLVITDPQLKLSEIPAVQRQVKALLDAELEQKTVILSEAKDLPNATTDPSSLRSSG